MNKSLKAELSAHYPDRKEVFETSDGLIHLEYDEAVRQAEHLPDNTIQTHPLPKPK